MKKKKILGTVLAATVALSATFTGCSLVSSNNKADMEQVIAEINITKTEAFDESEVKAYKDAVGTSSVIKRDLVAYFLNVGYSYIQSGLSYESVFTMLVESLVENAVLTQYSVMYLLDKKAEEENKTASQIMETYNSYDSDAKKYEYLLGEDSDEVKVAWYSVLSSLNSAIDSYEEDILDEDDSTAGTDTRTTPTGVDTEQDTYYPKDGDGELDYNVYTGYTGYRLDDSGAYKNDRSDLLKNKSTRSTRVRAYNRFVSSLVSNYLVDAAAEDLHDVLSLEYIQNEYVSQLEYQIINKYYDIYEEEQAAKLTQTDESDLYFYLEDVYNDLFADQTELYDDADSFTSAMSSMSDTSFILYAPNSTESGTVDEGTYGFVYNILLPFSTAQSALLTEYQTIFASTEDDGLTYTPDYYTARNALLKNIKTTDQRTAWFNGATEYAFNATEAGLTEYYGSSGWLFFENNLTKTDRYESLEKYIGKYSYNGTVVKAADDYVLIGNELTIDDMLEEFKGYVNYVLGSDAVSYEVNDGYYKTYDESNLLTADSTDKEKEIDYSNFVYATGKVNFGSATELENRHNVLKNGNDDGEASVQYKALAAVNELQYAYTTDTGVLSQYLGYSVATGDSTGYIKEFEYAAQQAIAEGAGAFAVCAGDYGWHLIYVTYTFDNEGGAQYEPDWSNFNVEGTFEYNFYEWLKSNNISDISTTRKTQIITRFSDDNTVVKYQSRYQDLLDLSAE